MQGFQDPSMASARAAASERVEALSGEISAVHVHFPSSSDCHRHDEEASALTHSAGGGVPGTGDSRTCQTWSSWPSREVEVAWMEVFGAQDGQDSQWGPGREQRTEVIPQGWGMDWGEGGHLAKAAQRQGRRTFSPCWNS